MTGRDNRLLNDRSVTCPGENLLTHHSIGTSRAVSVMAKKAMDKRSTRLDGLGKVKMEMQLFSEMTLCR